jgi:hypothetical protein
MNFGVAALPLHMFLKHAPRDVEGVVDHGVEILARKCRIRAFSYNEVRAGNRYLDSNAMRLTVLVPMVGRLDSHATMLDAVGKSFELRGSPTNVFFDGGRWLDATERDLDGDRHVAS